MFSSEEEDYYEIVNDTKNSLPNFYTYDISPVNLILNSYKEARDLDFIEKLRTQKWGDNFDEVTRELNSFLDEKSISVNEKFDKIIFTLPNSKLELGPEDLSHGELKKLCLYVLVKHIALPNSIIFFDELDIALHPSWQAGLSSRSSGVGMKAADTIELGFVPAS